MRMDPNERKQQILDAAIMMATCGPWHHLTRPRLAKRLGIADSLIAHHFGSMENLKDEVMFCGCRDCNMRIIMHGLSIKHPIALGLPDSLKRKAAVSK